MKHFSLFLFILLCSVALTYSDDDKADENSESKYYKVTTKRYPNYLGFAGGFITGHGLAYRRWIKDKIGFQINVLPIYKEEKYPEDGYYYQERDSGYYNNGNINFGGTFLIKFVDVRYIRFLGYVGVNNTIEIEEGNYYYTQRKWDSNIDDYIVETKHSVIDRTDNILAGGLGAGVEFYVFRFGFNIMLGLYSSYSFEKETKNISPSIDGGIFFRF